MIYRLFKNGEFRDIEISSLKENYVYSCFKLKEDIYIFESKDTWEISKKSVEVYKFIRYVDFEGSKYRIRKFMRVLDLSIEMNKITENHSIRSFNVLDPVPIQWDWLLSQNCYFEGVQDFFCASSNPIAVRCGCHFDIEEVLDEKEMRKVLET
jgi:hypothetical protein